jgi:hypothetical protein
MIVVLDPHLPPRLADLERLDRLHAEVHGPFDAVRLGDLCERADDEHVWLHVGRARTIGVATAADPAFGDGFDAMIGYAASKGWLNDAGTHARAHVEAAV